MMKRLLLTTALLTSSVSATPGAWQPYTLTREQHNQVADIVAAHGAQHLPRDVRDKLDSLAPDMHSFYTDMTRVGFLLPAEMDALTQEERTELEQRHIAAKEEYATVAQAQLQTICKTHGIEVLQDRNYFSFRMRLSSGWWVFKMRKLGFPLPFQNLSQVFYAHKIQRIITENEYTSIVAPQAFVYNVHGQQTYSPNNAQTAFNDDNWWVVEPYVFAQPAPIENRLRIKDIARLKSPAYTQIRELIIKAGLWKIKESNMFVYDEPKAGPVIMLINLEMPGLGGATAAHFFQQNEEEVIANGKAGLAALDSILKAKSPFWTPGRTLGAAAAAGILTGFCAAQICRHCSK